jgi:hypothetical protein
VSRWPAGGPAGGPATGPSGDPSAPGGPGGEFLARVAEACQRRSPRASIQRVIEPVSDLPYLRVREAERGDGAVRYYPVGLCENGVTQDDLDRFVK